MHSNVSELSPRCTKEGRMTGLHYSVVCSQNAKILLVIVCSHERHHVVSRDGRQLVSVRQRHTHRVSQKYHEENPAEGLLLEVTLLRQQLVSLLHLFRPGMVVESCGMVLFRLGFGMTGRSLPPVRLSKFDPILTSVAPSNP